MQEPCEKPQPSAPGTKNKAPEIWTFIDLEMNQPSGLIIELGGVTGNIFTGEILEELCCPVKIPEPLNPFIVKLTGWTDQKLEESGMSLKEAYDRLCEMHTRHGAFINLGAWGQDPPELRDKLYKLHPECKWIFGGRHEDTKSIYRVLSMARGLPFRGGLAKSMTRFGLKFNGTKHVAVWDSRNTFLFYSHMLKEIQNGTSKSR